MKALVVEKERIQKNLSLIHEKAGNMQIIGVLKANGYGLGLLPLARVIRDQGVSRFAVTEPEDALALRNAGFADEEILILRSTAVESDIETIFEACATATVGSYDAAVALNGMARESGRVIDAHIEIDTGMGRYGFLASEMERILSVYRFMENINVTGLYTHYHTAFASEKTTRAQHAALQSVAEQIRQAGFDPGIVHASNSAALLRYNLPPFDAVRVGSAVTGRVSGKGNSGLARVGKLEAPIAEVRWLPKKHPVGYGAAFVTKKPTRIAVISAGYGDGFLVERGRDVYRFRDMLRYGFAELKKWLSGGRFFVTIGGQKARVLGHVGLAHTTVDVTDLDCGPGDMVLLDVSPLHVDSRIPRKYV